MRVGVSGAHGTGKTTLVEALCARLPGHTAVDEPYHLLAEEGYDLADPPLADDFRAQLRRSLRALGEPGDRVVFDRTPLDFLAYLAAHGLDAEDEADPAALRAALGSLDLLVLVPVTDEADRVLPGAALPRLRSLVDEALLDLANGDPLGVCEGVPIVELDGRIDRRPEVVMAALGRLGVGPR